MSDDCIPDDGKPGVSKPQAHKPRPHHRGHRRHRHRHAHHAPERDFPIVNEAIEPALNIAIGEGEKAIHVMLQKDGGLYIDGADGAIGNVNQIFGPRARQDAPDNSKLAAVGLDMEKINAIRRDLFSCDVALTSEQRQEELQILGNLIANAYGKAKEEGALRKL